MALMTVEEYAERRYTERSRPPRQAVWRTIRRLKKDHPELFTKEGRRIYIDERALKLTGNPMVDKVLCQ